MPITLLGARLTNCSIGQKEEGGPQVSGTYSLLSSAGKVVATQAFNSYSEIKVPFSPSTLNALSVFLASAEKDINAHIGLGE